MKVKHSKFTTLYILEKELGSGSTELVKHNIYHNEEEQFGTEDIEATQRG